MNPATLPLWPLPLIAGLLPVAGAITAFHLSIQQELIPSCNPLIDGCVSVSRAGRHGLPNILFRASVLPAAALQGLTWVLCARWLASLPSAHAASPRRARWMTWLGITAAVFMVLYGTFLGTEGPAYRWLRQYGTVVYFGFTFLCMLVLAGELRAGASQSSGRWLSRSVFALCWLLLALGVGNAMLGPLFDPAAKDRLQNVTEWWGGIAFTVVFVLLAAMWRGARVVVRLDRA